MGISASVSLSLLVLQRSIETTKEHTFVQRPLQSRNQTPITRPPLPAILNRETLRFIRLFRPEAKIQQVHRQDEVDSALILGLGMQLVLRPGLGGILLLLHQPPDRLGGFLGASRVESDVNGVVEDVTRVLQDFGVGRRRGYISAA